MSIVVKKRTVTDVGELQSLVADHVAGIEPGLAVLDSRLLLGQATMDVVALDAHGTLVLMAVAFTADEEMLLRAVEAYSWCLEYPEAIRRLYPSAQISSAQPPRLVFVIERMPDAFHRKIKQLGFPEVDCVEVRVLEVDGTPAVFFDTLARLRRGPAVAPAPAPVPERVSPAPAPAATGRPTSVKLQKLLGGERSGPGREPGQVVSLLSRAVPRHEPAKPAVTTPKTGGAVATPALVVVHAAEPRITGESAQRSVVAAPRLEAVSPAPAVDPVTAAFAMEPVAAAERTLEVVVATIEPAHTSSVAEPVPDPEPMLAQVEEPALVIALSTVPQPEPIVSNPPPELELASIPTPQPTVVWDEPESAVTRDTWAEPEAAVVASEPEPEPAVELVTDAEPEPVLTLASEPEPEVESTLASAAEPSVELTLESTPEFEPEATLDIAPEPELELELTLAPESEPELTLAVTPEPEPEMTDMSSPTLERTLEPTLARASEPEPEPVLMLESRVEAEPAPEPLPPAPATPSVFSRRPSEPVAAPEPKVSFAEVGKDLLSVTAGAKAKSARAGATIERPSVEEITRATVNDLTGATAKPAPAATAFAKPAAAFKRPTTIAAPAQPDPNPIAGGSKLGAAAKRSAANGAAPKAPAPASAPASVPAAQTTPAPDGEPAVPQGFEGLQFPNDGVLTRQWMEFLNQMAAGK